MAKGNNIIEVECGFYVEIERKRYFSPDCLTDGRVYKDREAFEQKSNNVCYIPEYAFNDAELAFCLGGMNFYDVDMDACDTYDTIMEQCKEFVSDEDNQEALENYFECNAVTAEELAEVVFNNVCWTAICTELDQIVCCY